MIKMLVSRLQAAYQDHLIEVHVFSLYISSPYVYKIQQISATFRSTCSQNLSCNKISDEKNCISIHQT